MSRLRGFAIATAIGASVLGAGILTGATAPALAADGIMLKQIAHHQSGIFDKSAAEIVAFDPATKRLFVVNGATPSIDIMELGSMESGNGGGDTPWETATLTEAGKLDLAENEAPTSVAVHGSLVAAAVHGSKKEGRPGKVIFFTTEGTRINEVKTGFLPDMVTFTPDGKFALTANEGEPTDDMDPDGSVTIIDLSGGAEDAKAMQVTFDDLTAEDMKKNGVRMFPGKTPALISTEVSVMTVEPTHTRIWVRIPAGLPLIWRSSPIRPPNSVASINTNALPPKEKGSMFSPKNR